MLLPLYLVMCVRVVDFSSNLGYIVRVRAYARCAISTRYLPRYPSFFPRGDNAICVANANGFTGLGSLAFARARALTDPAIVDDIIDQRFAVVINYPVAESRICVCSRALCTVAKRGRYGGGFIRNESISGVPDCRCSDRRGVRLGATALLLNRG